MPTTHECPPRDIYIFPGLGNDRLRALTAAALLGNMRFKKNNVNFSVVPLPWDSSNRGEIENHIDIMQEVIKAQNELGHSISLLGVSAGVSVALRLLISNLESVNATVLWDGWIGSEPEELPVQSKNRAIIHSVHQVRRRLYESSSQKLAKIKHKTLVVTPKKDKAIPERARELLGAEHYSINYNSHLSATTIGVIKEMALAPKNSRILLRLFDFWQ